MHDFMRLREQNVHVMRKMCVIEPSLNAVHGVLGEYMYTKNYTCVRVKGSMR
jgi:hypothetical protein